MQENSTKKIRQTFDSFSEQLGLNVKPPSKDGDDLEIQYLRSIYYSLIVMPFKIPKLNFKKGISSIFDAVVLNYSAEDPIWDYLREGDVVVYGKSDLHKAAALDEADIRYDSKSNRKNLGIVVQMNPLEGTLHIMKSGQVRVLVDSTQITEGMLLYLNSQGENAGQLTTSSERLDNSKAVPVAVIMQTLSNSKGSQLVSVALLDFPSKSIEMQTDPSRNSDLFIDLTSLQRAIKI